MWPKTTKAGQDSISGLLPGLVAVSCLLAGWLLGYGLSPSTDAWTISHLARVNNGKFLTNVPAYRQDWAKSNAKWSDSERTLKHDSGR